MTPSERRAYNGGIKAAIDAARITAITIETADDASTFLASGSLPRPWPPSPRGRCWRR